MTKDEHKNLWSDPDYEVSVRSQAKMHGTDGCTGVPDLYVLGCYEHDIGYATGKDPLGNVITKRECDKRFRWYIQMKSPFGRFSPMSWWRWAAVSLFGKWRHPVNKWKYIKLIWLLLLISAGIGKAAEVQLEWDASVSSVTITNYTLHFSPASNTNSVTRIDSGTNLTTTVTLSGGDWIVRATATGANGLTSEPSSTIPVTVPNAPVLRLRLQGAAKLDGPWENLAALDVPVTRTNQTVFYRGQVEWEEK